MASYGKIIPKSIFDLPKNRTLNIHPSLLPKYRGSSPLQEQILNNESNVGVTIMLIDEKVDHGPIIIQQKVTIEDWPVKFDIFEKTMAEAGAKLFKEVINPWLENKVAPKEQNHAQATFTKKIEKADGELDIINGDPYKNYLKFKLIVTGLKLTILFKKVPNE